VRGLGAGATLPAVGTRKAATFEDSRAEAILNEMDERS